MTRIPDLERELVAAATRRYASSRRRRPSLRGLKLLIPVAAAVMVVVLAASALRTTEREVEVPAAQFVASASPSVDEFLRGPLGGPVGRFMVDGSVPPVSMNVGKGEAAWVVAVFAGTGDKICAAGVPRRRALRRQGNAACSMTSSVGDAARAREQAFGGLSVGKGRLVYGLVAEDARAVRIGGPVPRVAALSDRVFRRGALRLRLYAASFTAREVRAGLPLAAQEIRATYADGETVVLGTP